jgi:hypothetical protein
MGEEIKGLRFRKADFERFETCLRDETALLQSWFDEDRFSSNRWMAGFELEAWLTDEHFLPLPLNGPFLEALEDPLVVPELSQYNVEINGPPRDFEGDALAELHGDLAARWRRCCATASDLGARFLLIGTQPRVSHEALNLQNMTKHHRYRALNEQIMRFRQGQPILLKIEGRETLSILHRDLTFEAAATSFQIHLEVPQEKARQFYNASIAVSAPVVAASSNSPLLFGKDLWAETRIPLFEQAVALQPPRVTFGRGYAEFSLMEFFRENLENHPVLLPESLEDGREQVHHLRLHNGTIWRWNRPLVGFCEDGTPHLRIEHRSVPAGPSIVDSIANAALYYGLVFELAGLSIAPERHLSFDDARDNFYRAARFGIEAEIRWFGGKAHPLGRLLLDELLPAARRGLEARGITPGDISRYLGIVEERVRSGQTGSAWQRRRMERNGGDLDDMLSAYWHNQQRDEPVHTWEP